MRTCVTDVRLREWRAEDAASIAPMLDDPHLQKWSSMVALGVEAWIEHERSGERGPSLAICTVGDDRVLGKVALRLPGQASAATTCAAMRADDQPAAELSYWVLPQARGRGIASAAVGLMLERARAMDGVRSVVLDIEDDNVASVRVAERLGAERRAPARVVVDRGGAARTMIVFVIAV